MLEATSKLFICLLLFDSIFNGLLLLIEKVAVEDIELIITKKDGGQS